MEKPEIYKTKQGKRKKASDCDGFLDAYILKRKDRIQSAEEYATFVKNTAQLVVKRFKDKDLL